MAEPLSSGWNGPIIELQTSPAAAALATALAGMYPPEIRLRGARAILDQGPVNCCVSCAVSTCLEVLDPACDRLSPLFHYYETAYQYEGRPPAPDEGVDINRGLLLLQTAGICRLALHNASYDAAGVTQPPTSEARADAAARAMPYRPDTYVNSYQELALELDPVNAWKQVLAGGRPILAGIHLTRNYGAAKLLAPGDRTGGRHAISILGYFDSEASFIVQDSRGAGWALGGQWWLPYAVVVGSPPVVFQAFAVGYPN